MAYRNQNKTKQRARNCRRDSERAGTKRGGNINPSFEFLWQGFEHLRPLIKTGMFCCSEVSSSLNAWIKADRDRAERSCVLLSLAAHCHNSEEVAFTLGLEAADQLDQLPSLIGRWSTRTGRAITVSLLERSVWKGRHYVSLAPFWHHVPPNFKGRTVQVAIVPTPAAGILHALPFTAKSSEQWVEDVRRIAPPLIVGLPEDGETHEYEKPEKMRPVVEQEAPRAPKRHTPVAAKQPHAKVARGQRAPLSEETLIYDGICPPADPSGDYTWRSGMWPCFPVATTIGDTLDGLVRRPDVCSATVEYARLHGDLVRYLPVVASEGLSFVGERGVSCGVMTTQRFIAGDMLVSDDNAFTVEERGGYLCLVRHGKSCWQGVKSGILQALSSPGTYSLPGLSSVAVDEGLILEPKFTTDIDEVDKLKVQWTMEVLSNTDALETAALTRLRQDAGAAGYEGSKPSDAVRFVRALRQQYPEAKAVAGRYAWGYCFSCGKELPGRFKQRLCQRCLKGENSGLGRLVADGMSVCNAAVRVRYPGVVTTPTQHPPLKNVATKATAANFRYPLASSRTFCPTTHPRGAAHASGGLA